MAKTFLLAIAAVVVACTPARRAQPAPRATLARPSEPCLAMTYEPDSLRYFLPTYVHLTQRVFPDRITGTRYIARWRPDSSNKDGMQAFKLYRGTAEWVKRASDTLIVKVGWHETALPFGQLTLVESAEAWRGQAYYEIGNHELPHVVQGTVTAVSVACTVDGSAG